MVRKKLINEYVDLRCKKLLSEAGRSKKVTKQMWSRMDDDAKENALLTVIKDPDDRRFDDMLHSDWNKLPGWAQRDMMTEGWGDWSWSDIGHGILDVAGMVPFLGEPFDLANSAWYAAEGKPGLAALSAAAALPLVGNVATAGKVASKVIPKVAKAGKIAKYPAKAIKVDKLAGKALGSTDNSLTGAATLAGFGKGGPFSKTYNQLMNKQPKVDGVSGETIKSTDTPAPVFKMPDPNQFNMQNFTIPSDNTRVVLPPMPRI